MRRPEVMLIPFWIIMIFFDDDGDYDDHHHQHDVDASSWYNLWIIIITSVDKRSQNENNFLLSLPTDGGKVRGDQEMRMSWMNDKSSSSIRRKKEMIRMGWWFEWDLLGCCISNCFTFSSSLSSSLLFISSLV